MLMNNVIQDRLSIYLLFIFVIFINCKLKYGMKVIRLYVSSRCVYVLLVTCITTGKRLPGNRTFFHDEIVPDSSE